jgi:hypothetical protein
MLEVKDTRGTADEEGQFVRVTWGSGRSGVTLEQVTDEDGDLSDWWVSVGYEERAGRALEVVTRAHATRRGSMILSMAERVQARDKDLDPVTPTTADHRARAEMLERLLRQARATLLGELEPRGYSYAAFLHDAGWALDGVAPDFAELSAKYDPPKGGAEG